VAVWQDIVNTLIAEIRNGGMKEGERLPSEELIAQRFGVSRQTAHRALQELSRTGLIIRKRRWGSFVAAQNTSETPLIAVVFDYASDFPQGEMLRGIQAGIANEFHVLLIDAAGDPTSGLDRLKEIRSSVGGILAYPFCDGTDDSAYDELIQSYQDGTGVPIVFIDRRPIGVQGDLVSSNNYAATRQALEHLVAQGHRRIAFFSGDNTNTSTIQERHQAHLDICEELGVDPEPLTRWFPKILENHPDRLTVTVRDTLFGLAHMPDAPTALFCTQDIYSATVMDVHDQIPSLPNLAISSFNDWPANVFRQAVRIDRIIQPTFEIGRQASELLVQRMTERTSAFVEVRPGCRFEPASTVSLKPTALSPESL